MSVRLLMQVIGGALMARGVGDAALWEAAGGLVVTVMGFFWSRHARRALREAAVAPDSGIEQVAKAALQRALRPGRREP
ncbi:MAG: hypothetical protein K2X74_00545 [Acetobacteraceae bacterium]|nr:hypothetical protein [Acetobacteraceae bacterium]